MKKYIAFLLCLIIILSSVSCNDQNISDKDDHQTNNDITGETTHDTSSPKM